MPSTFVINPSAIPIVVTRKALLILDLQNDFLSPEGALPVEEPEGFVDRILELAKAFRDSGAGDVIWVRSEFECHRPLTAEGDQIITSDTVLRPQRATPSRGRRPAQTEEDSTAKEDDEEAFLSVSSDGDKKPCVRKGTCGAHFKPEVQAAVDARRDIVFTKTHYSAFASGQQQLVQLLRGRFVTQMYVCGALTNISIYATALDAGRHGYDMTIVEDCCGYRKTMRHLNAIRQLEQLTGSEVINSETLLAELQPAAPPNRSTGLSPSVSTMKLDLGGGSPGPSPAVAPRPTPPRATSPQPDVGQGEQAALPRSTAPKKQEAGDSDADERRSSNNNRPLTAEFEPSSSEGSESPRTPETKLEEARGSAEQSKPEDSKEGSVHTPEAASTKPEKPRVRRPALQSVSRSESNKKAASSPLSPERPASSARPSLDPKARDSAAEKSEAKNTEITTEQTGKCGSEPPHNMADPQPTAVCSEPLCEGDTTIITNVLPPSLAADAFERLLEEVSWAGMSHLGGEVPRRIAVQGAIGHDGSMPVYRHPADESPPLLPFSPTVLQIKEEVEKHLGHPLNHVLIQHYRSGNDYISEHSDKTLDIVKGSFIANVSLGAERTMVFRTKRPPKDKKDNSDSDPSQNHALSDADKAKRQVQRAALPHNSLCRMGLATNERWLHAIRQDKRSDHDKTPAERSHGGARISLTFRRIGTFIDDAQALIWGQGATAKTRAGARPVVNGQTPEAVRMLQAFGAENHASAFDWDAHYGAGFDVLHMGVPKRFCASTGDRVANARVALALAELGVSCAKGSVEGGEPRFEDNDPGRTVVSDSNDGGGHAATVLRYLDAVYGAGRRYDQLLPGEVAKRFARLQRGLDLLRKWRGALGEVGVPYAADADGDAKKAKASPEQTRVVVKLLGKELADWEAWAKEAAGVGATVAPSKGHDDSVDNAQKKQQQQQGGFYIAGGSQPSPADFALWPVLQDMVCVCGGDVLGEHLRQYYAAFKERSAAAKALAYFRSE